MIFVDTWAWVALADKRDPYHQKAKVQHKKLSRAKRKYVTTDYVLGETITYLYDAIGAAPAQEFISKLLAAVDAGTFRMVHVAAPQFRHAWQIRQN